MAENGWGRRRHRHAAMSSCPSLHLKGDTLLSEKLFPHLNRMVLLLQHMLLIKLLLLKVDCWFLWWHWC